MTGVREERGLPMELGNLNKNSGDKSEDLQPLSQGAQGGGAESEGGPYK